MATVQGTGFTESSEFVFIRNSFEFHNHGAVTNLVYEWLHIVLNWMRVEIEAALLYGCWTCIFKLVTGAG